MARKKTTVYVEEELLRAAKVSAARQGKRDYEVFEEALRAYLGFDLLERIWAKATMDPDEAMEVAVEEIHAMRREKREQQAKREETA